MYLGVWVTSKEGSDIQQMSQMRMNVRSWKGFWKNVCKAFNIKMTTHQSTELGFVQVIDFHVNV